MYVIKYVYIMYTQFTKKNVYKYYGVLKSLAILSTLIIAFY